MLYLKNKCLILCATLKCVFTFNKFNIQNMTLKSFKTLFVFLTFISFNQTFQAQYVYANQGGTAQALVNTMVGPGLTVTNPIINCPNVAYGTFSNGQTTNVGINSGVILTTGNINTLNGNGSAFWSVDNPGPNCNDPQLTSLEPLATRDCCILEFDVIPSCSTLLIRFVFGSEEYPEFVNAGYNDAFGFFVTGPNPSGPVYNNTNVATLPDNTTIVSIDNVNANTNSQFYVNNATGTSIKLDAFTTVLTREIVVEPCATYHFKMAIADAGDGIYDSGVFIDFLDCSTSLSASIATTPVSCAGNDGTATATGINGFPPYTYNWNTNPPQSTPSISGLAPGTYTVVVDDAGDCTPPVTLSFIIETDINVPQLTITGDTCVLNTSTLTASVTVPGGTYLWSTGETTETIEVSPTTTSTYTCTYDLAGCLSIDEFTVTKKIVTTFNPVSALCSGATPITLPIASANQPNITGTWNIPTINTNTVGTTNYIFTPSLPQCATIDTLPITIKPIPTITISPNQTICQGQQAVINSTVSIPGGTYDWQPVDSTTNNLVVYPDSTMIFSLVYTLDDCPSLSAYSTVTVNPNVPVYGGADTLICIGGSVTLTASGTPIIEWDSPIQDGVTFSPSQTATYTVYGTSDNGCVTVDYVTVVVVQTPIINPGTPPISCIGQQVVLNASGAGPNASYTWNNGVSNGVPFVNNQTKIYTVTGTDQYGCAGQATITVTALPLPNANFNPSTSAGYSPLQITFTNTSSNANNYVWDFGNGTNTVTTNLVATNATYIVGPQDYTIYMVASNGYCVDTVSKNISVLLAPEIFVPNVFTPNSDSSNEQFFLTTKNLVSFELLIFNRWGNLMAKITDPAKGWDGTTESGNEATAGVYFYKYKVTGMIGEEIEGQGFLTLIR